MAEVLIQRLEFIQDNSPFGTFVTGDVLECYIETTGIVLNPNPFNFETSGVIVYLNGSPIGSGPTIWLGAPQVSNQQFNPQICSGDSLLAFSTPLFFPYTAYYTQPNHYSCAVNPPTCDLIVVGVPSVVPATDSLSTDGSVLVVADSTNSIQYKLGSDFVYGDGSSQTDGEFTGLVAGSYRVFLRDSANCSVNVLVTVPVSNVYGTIYETEYEDLNGLMTQIQLIKRGYSGSVTQVENAGEPFIVSLRGEGSLNKFEPLQSIESRVNLLSETDEQFLEIYTNDPNLYRINYSKDFETQWIPDLDDFTNEDTGGTDWITGGNPSVTLVGAGSSDLLRGTTSIKVGVYALAYSFDLDVFSSVNLHILLRSGSTVIQDITIALSAGANSGEQEITISAVIDNFALRADNLSIGSRQVTINQLDIPNGFTLLLKHKILPQQYQEEYKSIPYYVNVTATDALPELESFYLIQDDGQKYYGTISLIKLVAFCLNKLKLDLPIRVACNLYADDMDQTDSDDPFDQSYIDFEAFYLAAKEPTLDFVLRSVLEGFGCSLKQWEGRWNIVRVDEQIAQYDFRDFDKDGEYTGNGTFDPIIDVDFPSEISPETVLVNRDHNLEIKPGYGQIKAIYKLGLKSNIINNGDFRLKSLFIDGYGYTFDINTNGFTIVNAGYTINQSYEQIDKSNVALVIDSQALDAYNSGNGGEAYIQTEKYSVKMGTNNQLKINIRYKLSSTSHTFGSQTYAITVPYTKLRVVVQYGALYLQSNGTWGTSQNSLTFFVTKYGEYLESEIIAKQPTSGTPTTGMDFSIRVYQPFGYYMDFDNLTDLRALPTYSTPDKVLPDGYLTEILDPSSFTADSIAYLRLEETTAAESVYDIIRPNDYHVTNNPRQWVKYSHAIIIDGLGESFSVAIDRIKATFLTDGEDPIDTIIRIANAEANNKDVLEKTLIIGSYSSLIVTETDFSIGLGIFFPNSGGGLTITTRNALSADLIYTGYLRDVDGIGYEYFSRDGVAESDKLHGIILKMYAAQYKRSWRMIRGSFKNENAYFGMLNVARFVNESNRIYLPISLSLSDRRGIYSSELMELKDIYSDPGSDGSGEAPFTSGFTSGFGLSSFN